MRFSIVRKHVSCVEYQDLSPGLEESLMDMDLIDPVTGEARQDYFDLPIEEGPVLAYLNKTFDLIGEFHIGCSTDLRPPSFRFFMENGSDEEKTFFVYQRELNFETFRNGGFFRKSSGTRNVRDLIALSEAYNQRGGCKESVSIGCYRLEPGRTVYSSVDFIFDGDHATLSPRIGASQGDYFFTLLDGTMIGDMLSRNGWKPVSLVDAKEERRVLFFMAQMASKAFLPKTCIRYPL